MRTPAAPLHLNKDIAIVNTAVPPYVLLRLDTSTRSYLAPRIQTSFSVDSWAGSSCIVQTDCSGGTTGSAADVLPLKPPVPLPQELRFVLPESGNEEEEKGRCPKTTNHLKSLHVFSSRMSFLSSRSDPGSSSQKITVSKRELEQLVEQEVRSAIKEKESNLDALLENIQQKLNQGMSYEASIKILQRRMMAVTHGAEQALALIRQVSCFKPFLCLN
ncbi:uncharacterized protein [Eucyclogobius newberryi]|uniref:uncharacterized protein n=1 Tax=Eucyclogobius newberryi TaxID=166745 RepID=UPI003B5C2DBE